MKTREQARRDIMRRTGKVIRDLRETIAVAEWWAEHRDECEPLDVEPERVALLYAVKIFNAARDRAPRIPPEWTDRMIEALEGIEALQA